MHRRRIAACLLLAVWLLCGTACAGAPSELPAIQTVPIVYDESTAAESAVATTEAETSPQSDDDAIALPQTTDAASTAADPTVTDPTTTTTATTAAATEPPAAGTTAHVHVYETAVVPATCTEKGYTRKVCACGETIRTDETQPLGHAFGTPTVVRASTCTVKGEQKTVCTRCGYTQTEQTPLAPHDLSEWVVTQMATETITGEEMCRCKVCGYTITRQIPARAAAVRTDTQEALEMLELINAARAQAGVRPLAFDYGRYVCAQVRAKEATESFSHTRPNGQNFITVISEQGCAMPTAWAENLQFSSNAQNSVQSAHEQLMGSRGHRNNVLDAKYATVAICVLRCEKGEYVAQLFCA